MLEPRGILTARAHVPRLPGWCEETSRRLPEDVGEDALAALDGPSSFFAGQPVHLVRALGQPRDRSPASLTLMSHAVKKQLAGGILEQPAVPGVRRQRPFAMPVGDDSEGEMTTEKGSEVPDHQPGLTRVGRRGVVDTDKESPHGVKALAASAE